MAERTPLTRDRLLRSAVRLADREGIGALTIRSLARDLGVTPMALYHHVHGKEEILDGIVDLVFAEIALPEPGEPWPAAMRRRAASARRALARHPWAVVLMESRTAPGPATMRHHEAVLASLRAGGFSVPAAATAAAVLDAFVYGFAVQEAALPFDGTPTPEVIEGFRVHVDPQAYPYMAEMLTGHVAQPGYDFGAEFDRGLDLILGALAP